MQPYLSRIRRHGDTREELTVQMQLAGQSMARTRGEKRRAKLERRARGRPRDENAERTPSGQKSRAKADWDTVIAYRMKQYGLTDEQARDPKAATALGRSWLRGEITDACYLAGEQYLKDAIGKERARLCRDGLAVTDSFGHPSDVVSEDYIDWAIRAVTKYEVAKDWLLQKEAEHRDMDIKPFRCVEMVVCANQEVDEKLLPGLRVGLGTLAIRYGLVNVRVSAMEMLEAAQ